jgi:iron(III) transport system substrate-binding protein
MTDLTRRRLITGAAALALPAFAGFVRSAMAETVDIAAARREGKVTLYTSAPIAAAQKVANAFQTKYGITVELFRSGGTQVLRRFMMEQQAGHSGADVLVSSDPAAVLDLAAKGLFVPFKPEGFDKVPAGLNDPDGRFVAQRVSVISIYGRTDLFPLSDMPNLGRPVEPTLQGQARHDQSVVHLAAARRGGDDGQAAWLGVLRAAQPQ